MQSKKMNKLTGRESQILKLIADGLSNREIADYLMMSIRTVEAHRARLMIKLSIYDIPGLVKYAIRQGITTVEHHGVANIQN